MELCSNTLSWSCRARYILDLISWTDLIHTHYLSLISPHLHANSPHQNLFETSSISIHLVSNSHLRSISLLYFHLYFHFHPQFHHVTRKQHSQKRRPLPWKYFVYNQYGRKHLPKRCKFWCCWMRSLKVAVTCQQTTSYSRFSWSDTYCGHTQMRFLISLGHNSWLLVIALVTVGWEQLREDTRLFQ